MNSHFQVPFKDISSLKKRVTSSCAKKPKPKIPRVNNLHCYYFRGYKTYPTYPRLGTPYPKLG